MGRAVAPRHHAGGCPPTPCAAPMTVCSTICSDANVMYLSLCVVEGVQPAHAPSASNSGARVEGGVGGSFRCTSSNVGPKLKCSRSVRIQTYNARETFNCLLKEYHARRGRIMHAWGRVGATSGYLAPPPTPPLSGGPKSPTSDAVRRSLGLDSTSCALNETSALSTAPIPTKIHLGHHDITFKRPNVKRGVHAVLRQFFVPYGEQHR